MFFTCPDQRHKVHRLPYVWVPWLQNAMCPLVACFVSLGYVLEADIENLQSSLNISEEPASTANVPICLVCLWHDMGSSSLFQTFLWQEAEKICQLGWNRCAKVPDLA